MKVLSKVLWALDLNEDHSQSLDKVLGTARQYGSEIILLHVLDPEIKGSSYQKRLERSVRTELDSIGILLRESGQYEVQIKIAYGNVSERILDVAEDEDVNVIFLNRGSASELAGKTLGLNSLKVARLSQKPMAIISNRPSAEKPHILVPVDFSEPSTLALNSAILHARKIKAKLTVITVFEPLRITSSRLLKAGIDEKIENKALCREMETRLTEYLQEFDSTGVDLHSEGLTGIPYQEIIWYSHLATVVYMGSTGKSGLRRALLGSVSEKVIQELEGNVVLIKSEELFKLRIPADLEDIQKHFQRGNELAAMGYFEEAKSQYHLCMKINELHLPSIWALADLNEKLGNKEKKAYFEDLANLIVKKMANRRIEEEIRRTLRSAG